MGPTGGSDDSGKNSSNVIGGHKAALKNPSQCICFHPIVMAFADATTDVSEEAKQHSQQVLEQEGYTVKEVGGSGGSGSSGNTGSSDDSGKNPNNVIGGLKAYVDDLCNDTINSNTLIAPPRTPTFRRRLRSLLSSVSRRWVSERHHTL